MVAQAAPAPTTSGPSLQIVNPSAVDLSENRRLVSVMFADLSGSTALGERLDPEDLRRILASYFNALSRQIQRYEGTVDKYIGDAVMAVFGAPVAHEDDAERAVNAGLAMQGAIAGLNDDLERHYGMRLALRIGINTGEVVAGLLGGDVQGAYTVVGDTVNTAQRFESAAPPGGVLVSESTWRLTQGAFEFEAIPPLVLKGKSEPQPAYRVTARRQQEAETVDAPLIGREQELRQLLQAFEAARDGRGSLVHVSGDAGVGKSRLLREFRGALGDDTIQLVARCASFETDTPFALIARLLRHAVRVQPGDDETTARALVEQAMSALGSAPDRELTLLLLDVLGYGEASSIDPQTRRRVLLSTLRRLLSGFAQRGVLLVLAEDAHWADAASVELLAELVSDVATMRCLFVTTSRPGWTAPWTVEHLQLEALGDTSARALVEHAFGARVDHALAETIMARTGGNPFFIEEVVKSLQESGQLDVRDGVIAARAGAAPRVPATVQEVLGARLDRLPQNLKQVLQPAAVCGRVFSVRLLEQLVPESDQSVAESLWMLERESFVLPLTNQIEPTYVFRHALIQEVAYQRQLQAQRRLMHAHVGQAMESLYSDRLDELVDSLAFHFGRSERDDKARQYLLKAGHRAQRLYARDEALSLFRAALERSQGDHLARAEALECIGDVERLAGQYIDALTTYRAALQSYVPHERVARANVLRKSGAVDQLLGKSDAALESYAAALSDVPEAANRERALVLIEVGDLHWRQGRFDEAIDNLSRAVAHAEAAGADDARADAFKNLGNVHDLKGDSPKAFEYYRQSLALYQAVGDLVGQANIHNNMAIVHRKQGRYLEALAENARALEIRERIGDPLGKGNSRNNLAQIHLARGDLDDAIENYEAALSQYASINHLLGMAIARTGLGIATVEAGDFQVGREHLLTALDEWDRLGSRTYLSETQRYIAQAYLDDDIQTARHWAELSVATARELQSTSAEGIALRILGLVLAASDVLDEAVGALQRSCEILGETVERQELARSLAALGRLYATLPADDRRRAETSHLLADARAIFSELGAELDLRRLEMEAAGR